MKKDKNINSEENEIEKLIKQALMQEENTGKYSEVSAECLSNEDISALYEGTLSENKRQEALKHLDECSICRNDLAFYYETMNPDEINNILIKIEELESFLPSLMAKLDILDFRALCRRISKISQQLIGGVKLKSVTFMVNEIWDIIETSFPSIIVRVRGELYAEKNKSKFSNKQLSEAGEYIQNKISQHINKANIIQQQTNKIIANPELWIFDHLTNSMKERATRIRDWCEERLEMMNSKPQMRCLPSVGVGCSKHMLQCLTNILKACENSINDSLSYFIVYIGTYCYHLGMDLCKTEEECYQNYKSHGKKTWDYIIGNPSLDICPAWKLMGFISEQEAMLVADICAGSSKKADGTFTELTKTQNIFLDGHSNNISPIILTQILSLADILNCNPQRLSSIFYLDDIIIHQDLINEFLKHEFIHEVNVDRNGEINITIRQHYYYPDKYNNIQIIIRDQLMNQIEMILEVLRQFGIIFPSPNIEITKSLFLEQHPYLK